MEQRRGVEPEILREGESGPLGGEFRRSGPAAPPGRGPSRGAPRSPRSTLSASSFRTRSLRVAPSAERTAISCSRETARARRKIGDVGAGEDEEQRHRAPEHQEHRAHRPDLRVPQGDGLDAHVELVHGKSVRRRAASDSSPERACSSDTPSRSRATTSIQLAFPPSRGVARRNDGHQQLRQPVAGAGGVLDAGPAELGAEDAHRVRARPRR